jgi:nicotinate-nucleotide adenylyltransferase
MRIGVLGGTFDPIHNAHLFVAEDARVRLGLDTVLVVPNGVPPHKKEYAVTAAEHRLRMVELAVNGSAHLRAEPMEVQREGPSYTADTLRALRDEHPGDEIVFITGADAVAEIGTWHEPEQVVRLCRLVAVSRPGLGLDHMKDLVPAGLLPFIEVHTAPEIGISATMIRQRVRDGLPIRYLTPDPVVRYINEHDLYRA